MTPSLGFATGEKKAPNATRCAVNAYTMPICSHSALCKLTGKGPDSKEVQAFLDDNLTPEVRTVLCAIRHLLVTEAHRVKHPFWIALDAALQRAKGNKCKWGGAQLVLEGDFLQLTEGGNEPWKRPLFAQDGFCHSFKVIYLDQQRRSHGDLLDLLGAMAMRCPSHPTEVHEALRLLQRPLLPAVAAKAVHLFGKVVPCRTFNEEMNQQLCGPAVTYKGTDSLGASDTRGRLAAQAALNASTNLLSSPLHLKVRSGPDYTARCGLARGIGNQCRI